MLEVSKEKIPNDRQTQSLCESRAVTSSLSAVPRSAKMLGKLEKKGKKGGTEGTEGGPFENKSCLSPMCCPGGGVEEEDEGQWTGGGGGSGRGMWSTIGGREGLTAVAHPATVTYCQRETFGGRERDRERLRGPPPAPPFS